MNAKIKIPVTFAAINKTNSWTPPISYRDEPQRPPYPLPSPARGDLAAPIKKPASLRVKRAHS